MLSNFTMCVQKAEISMLKLSILFLLHFCVLLLL